jgi:hypothetical protein
MAFMDRGLVLALVPIVDRWSAGKAPDAWLSMLRATA